MIDVSAVKLVMEEHMQRYLKILPVLTHDAAWVLTRSETSGTFRGKEIDLLGAESVLLRRGEHGWRIVHIHWSSRPRSRSH